MQWTSWIVVALLVTLCNSFILNPERTREHENVVEHREADTKHLPREHIEEQRIEDSQEDEDDEDDEEAAEFASLIWDSVVKSTVNTHPIHSMVGYWNFMIKMKEQIKADLRSQYPHLNEREVEDEAEIILSMMGEQVNQKKRR